MNTQKRAITIPFFFVFATLLATMCSAKDLINGFISSAPEEVLTTVAATPLPTPVVGGIKITYGGGTNFTDTDGSFSFEKIHPEQTVRLIITTDYGYDLLKNTVSKQEMDTKKPPMHTYLLVKAQEKDGSSAKTPPTNQTNQAPLDPNQWYWQVKDLGTGAPENGLQPHDLIIHADPKDFYLQNDAIYYAQESNHLIIPQEVIYLLRTLPAATITRNDNYTASVDSAERHKVVEGEKPVEQMVLEDA